MRERLKATFVQIEFTGPQEFSRRLEAETAFYGDIIRAANSLTPRATATAYCPRIMIYQFESIPCIQSTTCGLLAKLTLISSCR